MCFGEVAEYCPDVKGAIIGTNHNSIWVSNYVWCDIIYIVTDINFTLLNKNDLVYVFQLSKDQGAHLGVSWFKVLENLDHEVPILLIFPVI